MKELTEKEAWNKISSFCASSEHCKCEVLQKLKNWNLDSNTADRIINKLESENYLDEARYCRSFVHDKYRFDKWGRKKIEQALYQKKIPSRYIDQSIQSEINREEYLEILRTLLENKKKTTKASSDYERNGKLIRFALGRGFDMEDILTFITLD